MEIIKKNNTDEFKKAWFSDRTFFSTSQLKIIACFFMLLSHLAQTGFLYGLGIDYVRIADIFVFVGRIAMPIFCFFIVQGVIFTKDIYKYLLRMFIFALISEIPFDLAFYGGINRASQNVIFTLFLGAFSIGIIDYASKSKLNDFNKILISIIAVIIGAYLSYLLKTDYNYKGVIAIVLLYYARNSKLLTLIAILIGFLFEYEVWGYIIPVTYGMVYLSIPFILLYNGKRGNQNKWAFYIFYPAHLLLIYFLKMVFL